MISDRQHDKLYSVVYTLHLLLLQEFAAGSNFAKPGVLQACTAVMFCGSQYVSVTKQAP